MNVKFSHVFQPLQAGRLTLKNRMEFTPMVSCHASSRTGEVTDSLIEFMGGQARNGCAVVTIGATTVDEDTGADFYGELSICHDSDIAGLTLLADEVHRYGAKISVECLHAGRGVAPYLLKEGCNAVGPSSIPTPTGVRYVEELKQPQIDEIIQKFSDCAERLVKAEFDIMMIHGAHGNLLGAFLSPLTNHRTDWYGGSLENRMRFPMQVLQAIRARVGDKIALEYRISADEIAPGGMRLDDCLAFLQQAEPYIDIAHISQGLIVDVNWMPQTIPPYYMPHCHNVKYAEAAKQVLHIPVATVGSIATIEEAEQILAEGKADIIGMARPHMADGALERKAWMGKPETIRPCLRCLEGCGNIFYGKHITCSVNPVIGREGRYKEIQRAPITKKVLVVGGGPAGMMAAQTLRQRGHEVILCEKSDRLGGLMADAGAVPYKQDMRRYLEWDIQTTMDCGAEIRLNTEVTPAMIAEIQPDALVVAVGSELKRPPIPGINGKNVITVTEADSGAKPIGRRVIVCGGGLSGMECALALAQEGKQVTVVDQIPVEDMCSKQFFIARTQLMQLCEQNGVRKLGNVKVEEITEHGVELIDRNWNRQSLEADTVVIAFGVQSRDALADELLLQVPEAYKVGDVNHDVASRAYTIHNANHSAFNICVEI